MVNRRLELDLLREHLRRAAEGETGHAVLLLGESGVGKSRLVAELLIDVERHHLATISAQCLGRGAEPLLPIKDALAARLGRTPDRIRRTLLGAAPRLLDAIPFIGAFLGRIGDTLLDERQLRGGLDGIYEALSGILLGISEKSGLCLVLEDLHQADQDTLYFLNYFLRKIRGHRVLTVLTIQLEQLHEAPHLADLVAQWSREGYLVRTILPLERAHVGEYVRALGALGVDADSALVDRLFGLTGGNPFYLKETVQLLSGPRNRPEQPPDEFVLPPRLDVVLRHRLARAHGPTLQFLHAAAVMLQTTQEIEPIAHLMEASTGAAIQALDEACQLRLMREGPQGEINFAHDLMRRAVYADLGTTHRRYLHQRAAQWCEQAGRLASAAFHFEQAEQPTDMVRTALQAAADAEQSGMYHSALVLYQKVRPHMAIEEIGPLLGRTMITLGEWDQAQEVIDRLPGSDGRVRLLRSALRFVRGDFAGSREMALLALHSDDVDRIQVLNRLADIALYLGEFAEARDYAREALAAGEAAGLTTAQVPFFTMMGVTAYHEGDLVSAAAQYTRALDLVRSVPEGERDVLTETMLMGNLGNIALVRGDLAAAERLHSEALRMRREVADARGALHSLHALGRCRLGAGDRQGALALLDEAEQLAVSLGETLERAKITQTRAELSLHEGDSATSYELAAGALEAFERSQCLYDITHARLALSAAALATGREREAVEVAAVSRAVISSKGYGLLRKAYPQIGGLPLADRIAGGLTAYACGDALGLPYENLPPSGASAEEIETLRARGIWSVGDTSDDTALTVLTARCLVDSGGEADPSAFLEALAGHVPPVRGLGPSTTAAIERFRATGEIPTDLRGSTNGAAMRALPYGWAVPLADRERLLRLTIAMSRATHRDPDAQVAACVVAACGSWPLEGAGPGLLLEIAQEVAESATRRCGGDRRLAQTLAALASHSWVPPAAGISMEPAETVTAALFCVLDAASLRDALLMAVGLGGDADTVAAIVGGLLGVRVGADEVLAALPWSSGVALPPADEIAALAAGLARIRSGTG
jgi:ADP-ribosylglycohydrolase/tetratricopeptide (TPR) repeat protein